MAAEMVSASALARETASFRASVRRTCDLFIRKHELDGVRLVDTVCNGIIDDLPGLADIVEGDGQLLLYGMS